MRAFLAGTGLVALLALGCQQPDEETFLRLSLNDSLRDYDSIQVALLRANDSSLISIPFTGLLDSLKLIPLPPDLGDGAFIVRVRAYEFEGQIGVETYIRKQGGQQVVTRTPLVAPRPYSAALKSIALSIGTLQPGFHPDTLHYEVPLPLNIDSVKITPIDSDGRASILIDGIPFLAGDSLYKRVAPDSEIPVHITVTNHGHERIYSLSLHRDARAGPHLLAFVTEPNSWVPAFDRDSLSYTLSVSDTVDSLVFSTLRADSGVVILLNDTVVASGSPAFAKPLHPGDNAFVIELSRNDGAKQTYNCIATRQPPDTTAPP